MTVRRVPSVAGRENARLKPFIGQDMVTIRRDPVEPVPVGTCVAMVFRVTGYDQDCDGSLMARVERVGADGEETGWEPTHIGLYPDCTWTVDGPGELDALAG